MALVDDLLANGTVSQDTNDSNKVIFSIPIHVQKTVVNLDGFKTFAKQYGWTETVKNENGEDVSNPISQYEKSIRIVREYVREVFLSALVNKAMKDAQVAAIAQANALTQ